MMGSRLNKYSRIMGKEDLEKMKRQHQTHKWINRSYTLFWRAFITHSLSFPQTPEGLLHILCVNRLFRSLDY